MQKLQRRLSCASTQQLRILIGLILFAVCFTSGLSAQNQIDSLLSFRAPVDTGAPQPSAPSVDNTVSVPQQPPEDKRAFGLLPNYRTAEASAPFQSLTLAQKFSIATKDSIDYPVLLTTAFFAGISQSERSNGTVYGRGVKGFAYRYGISYVDQVVSNYLPEAIIPALLHDDPRYFRKSDGSIKSRTLYAIDQIIVGRTDAGTRTFNAPEVLGNGLAAVAGLAYHSHERTGGAALSEFGILVTTDMAGNIAKEFWPDLKSWYKNRGH